MACKCLIFDWDGTLIDSAARIVACLRSAAAEMHLPDLSDDKLRYVIGLSLNAAVDFLYADHEVDLETRQQYGQAYKDHFLYKNKDPVVLFDEVENMLRDWQQQGYLLAVATGKSRVGLQRDFNEFNLASYFDVTKTADETASKPDPLMLREILLELDLKADEAMMIGDTSFDISMGQAINMPTVGLAQGAHPKDTLAKSKPDVLLDSIGMLPNWLAEKNTLLRSS